MTNFFRYVLAILLVPFLTISNGQSCTLEAATCIPCATCDIMTMVDLTNGIAFNRASQFGVDFGLGLTLISTGNYASSTNMGTLTIPAGTVNVFSVSGVSSLPLPADITSFCYTADINVISGSNFTIEFRIENGFGDPGSGGSALETAQVVNGPGACSIGGNWTLDPADTDDFANLNGFSFTPNQNSNAFVLAFAAVDFSNNPVAADVELELSNIQFSYCTPSAPEIPVFTPSGPIITRN